MSKNSYLTFTDLFCGAGGTSLGAVWAGLEIKAAANHWQLACDTYATNHAFEPRCADISHARPELFPSTDFLLASPECTNHSLAKGVQRKQLAQESFFGCESCLKFGEENCPKHSDAVVRSRATMWDVPRFAERHRYKIVIVENVVDVVKWELFEAWLMAMHSLGYKHRVVSFNSMFALDATVPTPQSRDRVYVVFWRKGNRAPDLDVRPLAFCLKCERNVNAVQTWKRDRSVGRYGDATRRGQYFYSCPTCRLEVRPYYYAAINAIDFSIRAERIGDRARKLKERTMGRLRFGAKKYGRYPLLITTNMTSDGGRSRPVASPAFTQTGSNLTAVASPFMVETAFSHAPDDRTTPVTAASPTQSTRLTQALVSPAAILHMQGMERVHGLDEATSTQVASCTQDWLMSKTPFLVNAGSNYVAPRGADAAAPTQTGSERVGVALPPAFITSLRGTGDNQVPYTSSSLAEACGTVSAGGIHAGLVSGAALLNLRDYRTVEQLVSGLDSHAPTQVATLQTAIIQPAPFIASYYSGGGQASGMDEACHAISTRDRHSLVVPDEDDEIDIENWFFRMFVPAEVLAVMGFPKRFKVLGNNREIVKQAGNAVTPNVPNLLIPRCVASLHPELAA